MHVVTDDTDVVLFAPVTDMPDDKWRAQRLQGYRQEIQEVAGRGRTRFDLSSPRSPQKSVELNLNSFGHLFSRYDRAALQAIQPYGLTLSGRAASSESAAMAPTACSAVSSLAKGDRRRISIFTVGTQEGPRKSFLNSGR